jgi:hypothetical protein
MRRFFCDESFWNQPIGPNPRIDPRSERLISLPAGPIDEGFGPLHINIPQ